MARVRPVASAACLLILVVAAAASAVPLPSASLAAAVPLAAVAWPPSSGLLAAEVVTGGASASDEFIELTNASPSAVDLQGLELVYATSTGSTVTRKASWTSSLVLAPGRHLLIANVLGSYAAIADATYSGGLSAAGGAVALRAIGGQPLDSVGWGDATNGFVEGTAVAAPTAGSSIERRPGGTGGNVVDTNDNAADFAVNASPAAQNLASPPVPGASPAPTQTPSPSPSPSAMSSPAPTPSATAVPTPKPTPTATPAASVPASPTPTLSPSPTPELSLTPSPTAAPTPSPSTTPAPTPMPTPTPAPSATPMPSIGIASARMLADGTPALIEGVLTTGLGALESGRSGFIQDATGGIGLYLDAALVTPFTAGTRIRVAGVVDNRYAQRTLRVGGADIVPVGPDVLPAAAPAVTGAAGEPLEGLRLELSGTVTETPVDLADGLGLLIDDGTGAVRVVVGPEALGDLAPTTGTFVIARGPLGQRDSGSSGLAGYRLYATLPGGLEAVRPSPTPAPTVSPVPSPTPTPTPTPRASPTATLTPSPTPSQSPTPTATPGPSPTSTTWSVAADVASARVLPVGSRIAVRAVVTAEAGRLGMPSVLAIGDATGGLPVRLPDGAIAPARGMVAEIRGVIASPYGQMELRAVTGGVAIVGTAPLPVPLVVEAGQAGEAVEGRLATIRGTISVPPGKATGGDLAFLITGEDGRTLRVRADASAGLDRRAFGKGLAATFTGIVGQRATRKGALDGYRLWLRDAADVARVPAIDPSPTPGAGVTQIAAARLQAGARVTVEGVLTIDRTLLDAGGRRTVVEDGTGAIEVYLPAPDGALHAGLRVQVTGTVGRAYGAARLRADEVLILGTAEPKVLDLARAAGPADEWRLVRVTGTIRDVHRLGRRWIAELGLGPSRIAIVGLAGSGIEASVLAEGRRATIVGIVRPPYPSAGDRRFAIAPRGPADIVLGPATTVRPGPGAGSGGGSRPGLTPAPIAGTGSPGIGRAVPDVDLDQLAGYLGQRVRVGGLVAGLESDGARLDDGTATIHVTLAGDAVALASLLEPGDALNVVGTPERRGEIVLVVTDPESLVLAGDPAAVVPDASPRPPAGDPAAGDPAAEPADEPAPADESAVRASLVPGMDLDVAPAGLGTLLLVAALSIAVTAIRRHRARRLLEARIVARLQAVGRGAQAAEREGSSR